MLSTTLKMDMLSGGIFKKMIIFALPLIASGALQQSFNSVDVAVVGKFDSDQALAAVGSNGMIISLLVNLFIGVSVGANVIIANYIGRDNEQGIRRTVSTVGVLAIISGVALAIIGNLAARPILQWMDTPADVIDPATVYLRIIFSGMPFMMAYNFGSAILRSMGDTRRPFYILIVGGAVNALLDLVFVLYLDMGVAGVATATVIANGVNAAIMVRLLMKEADPFGIVPKKLKIHRQELIKVLKIGIPAGLQGMIFSIANVFIQSAVNRFGSDVVAGNGAAINFEYYCYFVISAFAQAAVAFTSQNYGAGKYDRCRRIFLQSMALSVICCGILNVIIYVMRADMSGIFTNSATVVGYASVRISVVLLFQFVASSYEVSGACLRGLGYSMTPTVITIFGTCLFRLLWIYAINPWDDYLGLLLVYPISWIITGAVVVGAYTVISRKLFSEPPHAIG